MSEASLTSNNILIYEGILLKKGQVNKNWKERWFKLYNNRRLKYFENKNDKQFKGEIDLTDVNEINQVLLKSKNKGNNNNNNNNNNGSNKGLNIKNNPNFQSDTPSVSKKSSDRPFTFELVTKGRTYKLASKNDVEFNRWLLELEKIVFGGRLYAGWLIKRGAYRKSWKKRWFVIYDTQEMRYYDDNTKLSPKGMIKLHDVLLMCPGDQDQYSQSHTIQLMTPDRNWVLATESLQEREEWFSKLEEIIHGAKRLITSHESYLWKRGQITNNVWKKRYFALSKGWLFYFEEQFHCNKFKSIAFFSEAFFNQAFRLYVKGSIPLHQTIIQKVNVNNDIEFNKTNNNNNSNEITNSNSITTDSKEFVFKIKNDKRIFYFACDTQDDLDKWFKAFHATHSNNETSYADSSTSNLTSNINDDNESKTNNNNELNGSIITDNDDDNDNSDGDVNDNILSMMDPNGTGKWVDLEMNENLRKTQRKMSKPINKIKNGN